jgi:putative endonuclease
MLEYLYIYFGESKAILYFTKKYYIMPLPFCVYILFSQKDLFLYIGFTTNIQNRLTNHNAGGTKSTSPRRPLELIFCEFYVFEKDARNREMYFKTTSGKKAIKYMLNGTLEKMGYAGKKMEMGFELDDSAQ